MPAEPNPPEKPSIEKPVLSDKIADILLKVVMTGGVAGGGLGAAWSLFKESDVPKAIASAVIGVGISYGASLLTPLHQGNKRRLENAGKAIDKGIERTFEQAGAKVRGVEDQYFHCQASACERNRSEGMPQADKSIFITLLEEVFVPLQLDYKGLPSGYQGCESELRDEEKTGQKIWDLIRRADQEAVFRQLVILAWGGYGKTTLLKHIAYTYGKNQQDKYQVRRRTPFLLVLRTKEYRAAMTQEQPLSLPDLITQKHVPSLPDAGELKLPKDWVKNKLLRGDAIVMFDGFDEVPKSQRPLVAKWMNDQMRQYGKTLFILTARPKAYEEQDAADRLEFSACLWVQDFDADQRRDFVERWYQCQERYAIGGEDSAEAQHVAKRSADELLEQIEARKELRDITKNPLLLNMIVTFHRRFPGAELPRQRTKLYQEICALQLKNRPGARNLETLLLQCEAQTILQMLALEMMQDRQAGKKESDRSTRIEQAVLLKRLDGYLRHQREMVKAKDFLDQVVDISELLVKQEDEYEFAHLSFQEYLAALQIVQQQQEAMLYEQFDQDAWKQTILLYAALVKNPTQLITEAMERDAVEIAYACMQATSRQVDAELTQRIKTARLQPLEMFLQNQQWKEADYETYRLMITTVGKDEGRGFTQDELLNFPCEELRAIDGLWVKYSQGRFGFSVQKQIYVECGGKLDGEEPSQKVWEVFGDRVGWKQNGNWMNYTEVLSKQISLSSPKGIFPFCFGGVFGWLAFWRVLFSRTSTCEL
jgi:hypothetical protein